jgi:hypothetical protein
MRANEDVQTEGAAVIRGNGTPTQEMWLRFSIGVSVELRLSKIAHLIWPERVVLPARTGWDAVRGGERPEERDASTW